MRYHLVAFLMIGMLAFQYSASAWDRVPPTDLSALDPSDFADDELDMPYLLNHFHRIANSVVEDGENRGFIDIPVWRNERDNEPYNARVMENHLTFAFFYCTDRPWNPYYADPIVRGRLEAVLRFWCNMQNDDGRFSEYGHSKWNLPATAFATKFMGQTLTLLADGPPIDDALHQRVIESDRKAIIATLGSDRMYTHGKYYTNQYSNVWAGASAYVDLFDDEKVQKLLKQQMQASMDDFQSPAGYFYEANGPDWGYNMGTHHSNLRMAWHYNRGTELGQLLIRKERLWFEWLAYNAPPEPDGSRFVLNRSIETRTHKSSFARMHSPLCEEVPLARAFAITRSELQRQRENKRRALVEDWPEVPDLRLGSFSAYSPYSFLHRDHHEWHPTDDQRDRAFEQLPHIARERFIHQRIDDRLPVQYTFVRRPAYYAALNTGKHFRGGQRYGIGLLWRPDSGAVLQSQSAGKARAWGTMPQGRDKPYEAGTIKAQFAIDGEAIELEPGARDLPHGQLHVAYPLGDNGRKSLQFADERLTVSIEHNGTFTENLPLLLAKDALEIKGRQIVAGDGELAVEFDTADVSIHQTGNTIAGKPLTIVSLTAEGELAYTFVFDD